MERQKLEQAAGKITRGTPRTIATPDGDQVVQDTYDAQGNYIGTEILPGSAPDKTKPEKFLGLDGNIVWIKPGENVPSGVLPWSSASERFRYFENAEGDIKAIPLGTSPPAGYRSITTRNLDMTEQQTLNLRMNLANTAFYLVSGRDSKGNIIEPRQHAVFIEQYNELAEVYEEKTGRNQPRFMMAPPRFQRGPYKSTPNPIKLDFINPVTGRFITPEEVEEVARNENVSVREVLTRLGIKL